MTAIDRIAEEVPTAAGASPEPAPALALLASPPFLLAVALLLLNDHLLKAAYGNWLTGKLSDFAGMFAFALFGTALFPRRRRAVFALTAVAFACWKSPLSEPALAAWNALGILPLARVVDYTDWIALLALVPAYHLALHPPSWPVPPRARHRRRFAAVAGAAAAVLAFSATSIAPRFYSIHDRPGYAVPAGREDIAAGLRALSVLSDEGPDPRRLPGPGADADTLAVLVRQPPERRVHLWVEVRETEPGESAIRLIGARADGPIPHSDSLHPAYLAQVHEPLLAWLARHRDQNRR